jgi:hypothetical protein
MTSRAEKTRRIVAVQKQLQRIEDWKMLELKRRLRELEASQEDMIKAQSDEDIIRGELVELAVRRLRSLVRETGQVSAEKDVQAARVLDQASKLKLAERLESDAAKEAERTSGHKQLSDIIEGFLTRKT